MAFVHRLRVRYHECDAQGVVFNANHFAYFDVAMTEFWRSHFGSYTDLVQSGVDCVVREANATFHGPVRFDDEIEIHIGVDHVGTTSMVLTFSEQRDGEVLVEGRNAYVFIDPATKRKIEVPAHVREALGDS